MNRVVVTGIGVVSPVGSTLEDFWPALVEGRSAIGPFSIPRSERLSTLIAAQVSQFDPALLFEPKQGNLMDRFSQFAVVAARAALRDSGLDISERLALETATVVGNASAGQTTLDDAFFKLYSENSPRLHPLTIPRLMTSAARPRRHFVNQVAREVQLGRNRGRVLARIQSEQAEVDFDVAVGRLQAAQSQNALP